MSSVIPGKILVQKEVKSSSSNNVYIVTIYDNCISCTCPAGGKKTFCKHLQSLIFDNLESIKNENECFYNDLILLMQMKNDKYRDNESFKQLSHKVIYSNKEIANKSYLSGDKIKKDKEYKFTYIIEKIENNFSDEQKATILEILPYLNDNLKRTEIYLKRRLDLKKQTNYININLLTGEVEEMEQDYIAGGKLIEDLLEKYKSK